MHLTLTLFPYLEALLPLHKAAGQQLFQRAFDFPKAYRTSNQVDRPMNDLDRTL
jgi:hypothetical protein